MQAEIITIGDEILIGQVVDTNSAYISSALNKIGVSVYQITSVQDQSAHILKALEEAQSNADIIIITGGLGPTKDDITKTTIAHYFQDTLVEHPGVLKNIEHLWETQIKQPLTQVNRDQALVPSKAQVLMNLYGSAPGLWIEAQNKIFVALPGVPFEMKALIENEVLPKLKSSFQLPYILHKTILTYGLGESALAARIELWEDNLPSFIKLAYLPNLGKVRLRLSAKHPDRDLVNTQMAQQIELLLPQISDIFYGFEDEASSIQALVAKQLTKAGKTLAIAESCTGGKLAASATAIPGASKYFKGGIVSYATQTKIELLGIAPSIIKEYSVVSHQVAEAMALSVLNKFGVDYAMATTGNAGPEKGESQAAVGTVYIAIATKKGIFSEKFTFGNHRKKVVNKAVNKAFELLQKEILKNEED